MVHLQTRKNINYLKPFLKPSPQGITQKDSEVTGGVCLCLLLVDIKGCFWAQQFTAAVRGVVMSWKGKETERPEGVAILFLRENAAFQVLLEPRDVHVGSPL